MKSRDPQKVTNIYNATLDLVYENGLSSLTINAISEQSRCDADTIISYFETKDGILEGLFIYLQIKNSEEIYSEIVNGDPFMINLKRVYTSYFMGRWENVKIFHFLDEVRNAGLITEDGERNTEQVFSKAYELLEQGKRELLVKYEDSRFLLSYMTGGIKEIIRQMKMYDLPLDQKAMNTTFELCASVILR